MTKKDFIKLYCKEDCNSHASFVLDLDELLKTELLLFLKDYDDTYMNQYGQIEIDPPDDVMDADKWVVEKYLGKKE